MTRQGQSRPACELIVVRLNLLPTKNNNKLQAKYDKVKKIIDLSSEEARKHFLKGSSYLNADIPSYISFEPILTDVAGVLNGESYTGFKSART